MTSAGDRRLAKLEGAMPPREAVLAWLAEAQQFPGLVEYSRSIVDLPIEAAPLSVISKRVEAAAREALKGHPRHAIEAAVRCGVRDALFLFCLVIQINAAAREISQVEGLRASGVFYWMGSLLGGPRESDLEPGEWVEHQKEQASAWGLWRGAVANLLVTMTVEEDARAELESRYSGWATIAAGGCCDGVVEVRRAGRCALDDRGAPRASHPGGRAPVAQGCFGAVRRAGPGAGANACRQRQDLDL